MKDILHSVEDILKNSKQSLTQKAISNLDVVTREEFDIQVKILAKTRKKLEELEKKVDKLLEKKTDESSSTKE